VAVLTATIYVCDGFKTATIRVATKYNVKQTIATTTIFYIVKSDGFLVYITVVKIAVIF